MQKDVFLASPYCMDYTRVLDMNIYKLKLPLHTSDKVIRYQIYCGINIPKIYDLNSIVVVRGI